MVPQKKYCIGCDPEHWTTAIWVEDDKEWRFKCGVTATQEGQEIVDRNFGKLYDLEAEEKE